MKREPLALESKKLQLQAQNCSLKRKKNNAALSWIRSNDAVYLKS